MAYVAEWAAVVALLNAQKARQVKATARGDVYRTSQGKYIKVARNGAGYDVQVYGDLASCGCG